VKIIFPAGAVVSIHKCQLADQQVSIGSQVAVNDRIASFQYWSGVEWIGLQVAVILDILMMEFFGLSFWKWVILINNYLLPSSLVERIRTTFPGGVIG
jgi:hypothetical protein